MILRPYRTFDAEHITRWITDEREFRMWSADRYGAYPPQPDDINEYYRKHAVSERLYAVTAADGPGSPFASLPHSADGLIYREDSSRCDDLPPITGHFTLRFPDEDRSVLRLGFVIIDNARRGRRTPLDNPQTHEHRSEAMHGYGRRMVILALRYAFEILNVRRVTLGVFEDNIPARKCYLAAGFRDVTTVEGKEEYYSVMNEKWRCVEMECTNQEQQQR